MKNPALVAFFNNRRLWRSLFWPYLFLLTLALLWPNAKLPDVMPRPDLIVHYLTFGLFALLMCLSNPIGASSTGKTVLFALIAGVAYGGLTELLQSIPILHRTAALDDWAADSMGVGCGLLAFAALNWWRGSR